MSGVNDGDIVNVVLDVVHIRQSDGREYERVLFQGVFARGAAQPPLPDGAIRNVVQGFFGRDMRGISAFLIDSVPRDGDDGDGGQPG